MLRTYVLFAALLTSQAPRLTPGTMPVGSVGDQNRGIWPARSVCDSALAYCNVFLHPRSQRSQAFRRPAHQTHDLHFEANFDLHKRQLVIGFRQRSNSGAVCRRTCSRQGLQPERGYSCTSGTKHEKESSQALVTKVKGLDTRSAQIQHPLAWPQLPHAVPQGRALQDK